MLTKNVHLLFYFICQLDDKELFLYQSNKFNYSVQPWHMIFCLGQGTL